MFAVVDRGTARTPWEFSLGFASPGATGTLFPKNPKKVSRCQHPVVRAPAASRRGVSNLDARVGVATHRATRSSSFTRVCAETSPHAPRACLYALRDD